MKFEPQGEPSHTFSIQIPNSQLNTYKAGGLLKYKRYKVSVRAYNLNGKGASNDSAVAWAWTQEDGKNPYALHLNPVCRALFLYSRRFLPCEFFLELNFLFRLERLCVASDVRCPMSDVRCSMSDVRYSVA